MAVLERMPWWAWFPLSIGAYLMSVFAPPFVPEWMQYVLFVAGLLLFAVGVVAFTYHVYSEQDAGADADDARLQAYQVHADNAFRIIGDACGQDKPLVYEMALTSIEPIFLLLKKDGFEIPRLRRDGTKVGILRAHRYLNLLHPALAIGNDKEARRRAMKAVPLINAATEQRLWQDVEKAFGTPALPSPAIDQSNRLAALAQIRRGRPPPAPPAPKGDRDTPIAMALGYATTAEWGKSTVHGMILGGGSHVIYRVAEAFRLAALKGDLRVWGRRERGGLFEQIQPSFWEANTLDADALFSFLPYGRTEPLGDEETDEWFCEIMVNRAEVERVWPHAG